jgi:hypothetical protein
MSQNDPGGFERNFLDSDVDLEIGHPSPGAEIYSRSSSFRFPSARSLALLLLFTGATVASTYYYAYQEGAACRLWFWPKTHRLKCQPSKCQVAWRQSPKI